MKLGRMVFVLIAVACNGQQDGGSDDLVNPLYQQSLVYRCATREPSEELKKCIVDSNRRLQLAQTMNHWTPEQGQWLSLQFETQFIKKTYSLTSDETRCLIKNFCQEQLP